MKFFRFWSKQSHLFALLLSCLGFMQSQDAIQQSGNSKWFLWHALEGHADMAEAFSFEADSVALEAHQWLGLDRIPGLGKEPRSGELFWVRNRQGIAKHLKRPVPNWFAAVALPAKGQMVLAVQSARGEYHLRSTMRHELLHHVLGGIGHNAFQKIPSWFHEGLAEEFSGEVYLADSGLSLSWMAMSGGLRYLSDFERDFGENAINAAEGYALGHAFVSMLVRDYGQPVIGEILLEIHNGASLNHALIKTTGFSVITLEEQMRKDLVSFRAIANEFYRHLITVLFLFATFLLPVVWIKKKRRRKQVEAGWELQDEESKLEEDSQAFSPPYED